MPEPTGVSGPAAATVAALARTSEAVAAIAKVKARASRNRALSGVGHLGGSFREVSRGDRAWPIAFVSHRPVWALRRRAVRLWFPHAQTAYICLHKEGLPQMMLIATTPFIAGWRVVETKGHVFGLVVRSRGLGGNIMAGLRSLGGGEIKEYTSLLEDTRRQAIDRLVQNATMMGANAVLSMRFDSSELAGTMSEIVAYGTAVVVAPENATPPPPPPLE